ncbi:MAG: hypothetical protein PF489_02360 [Salinivirgaceae bacterium]|jgi:hypothetical protein|nr:hypothetical protein [Salinivirgaceae bacterium]
MKHIFTILITALISLSAIGNAQAQCRKYTKNTCIPQLEPYIFNGQINSALLNEGDIAELVLTFYADQEYRVMICSEDQLGDIGFKLKDTKDKTLFDNREHNLAKSWDFESNTTQQIIVEIEVPEMENTQEKLANGCVSILVGFKESE